MPSALFSTSLLASLLISLSCAQARWVKSDDCPNGFEDRTFNNSAGYRSSGQNVAKPSEVLSGVKDKKWYHPTAKKYQGLGGFGGAHSVSTGHEGLDIIDRLGNPIFAAAAGQVVYTLSTCANRSSAGYDPYCGNGWGNHIVIDHGVNEQGERIFTRYAHLNQLKVRLGAQVARAQEIASMGHSGASDTPHLHFELGKMKNKTVQGCQAPQNFDRVYNPTLLPFTDDKGDDKLEDLQHEEGHELIQEAERGIRTDETIIEEQHREDPRADEVKE